MEMNKGIGHNCKKWANPGLFFVYFCSFLVTISIQIEKSVDGVLGIRTQGRRMVGTDETTEQWHPPWTPLLVKQIFILTILVPSRELVFYGHVSLLVVKILFHICSFEGATSFH